MTDIVDRRISDDALPALCRERAEAYGALRQSSLTAIALDQAADTIEQLRARIAEAVLAEREACAVLIETTKIYHAEPPSRAVSYPSAMFRKDAARAIRERTDDAAR